MFSPFRQKKYEIPLVSVDLGAGTVRVPVAELSSGKDGKTLLITAGNDGDEYAGIEACYRIIEEFSHTPFSGKLIVIPIVNIPGFEVEMSQNPLDGKFPKLVYPGSIAGSSSERLRFWLSGYVSRADFWMDLHGGSLTERVNPYVHAWKSPDSSVNNCVKKIIDSLAVSHAIYQDSVDLVRRPSKGDCAYLMCESGSFGAHDEQSILRHIDWVHSVLIGLKMVGGVENIYPKKIYSHVQEYYVRDSGIWNLHIPENFLIRKDMLIGEVNSFDGKHLHRVRAKQDGVMLWAKEGMSVRSGDCVIGVGY